LASTDDRRGTPREDHGVVPVVTRGTSIRPIRLIAPVAALALGLLAAPAASAQPSYLKEIAGPAGCISEYGKHGCRDAVAMHGVGSIVFSADGENAYAAAQDADSVLIFNRNVETGALKQKSNPHGCVSNAGHAGQCVNGRELDGAETVAISPDGANVYIASRIDNGVAVFDRDPANGRLTQKPGTAGCISVVGAGPPDNCADGTALDGASKVAVSPDGANVYVASRHADAVAVFDRDPVTGALTEKAGTAACISEDGSGGECVDGAGLDQPIGVIASPDGNSVYVASADSGAVAVFDRNPNSGALTQLPGTAGCISEDGSGGACSDGRGLGGVGGVEVSEDGHNVYAAAVDSNAITTFDRDPGTGALTQKAGTAGCISRAGADGCASGRGLAGTRSVVASADGRSAYGASLNGDGVTIFDRDPGTGILTQPAPRHGCINEEGVNGCADGYMLDGAERVAVAPGGAYVYAAVAYSDAIVSFRRGKAPNTKITKAPKAKVKTGRRAATVTVAFKSEEGASFRCRLDDRSYVSCTSPWSVKARSKPGKGKRHKIRIKARDVAGNVEKKPASVGFRVIRRR
jgi:DNA-binding beta-propeller fold protein YncE